MINNDFQKKKDSVVTLKTLCANLQQKQKEKKTNSFLG